MAKINTHGLVMTGLREASSKTKASANISRYCQISYIRDEGRVKTDSCILRNSDYVRYLHPEVFIVSLKRVAMTQQEIADRIWKTLEFDRVFANCER